MSRTPQNKLTIEPIPDGGYRLFGFIPVKNEQGNFERTKVRRKSADLVALQTVKKDLEDAADEYLAGIQDRGAKRWTYLTEDLLRDCEAGVRKLHVGCTISECIDYWNQHVGTSKPALCADTMKAWEKDMKQRKCAASTIHDNLGRTGRFLKASQCTTLLDVTDQKAKDWVYRPGLGSYAQIGDAKVLTAWLNFCVRERLLKINPLRFNLVDMNERARPVSEPAILMPDQAQRLLDAAMAEWNGKMVPYVILSLWCFARPTEVRRLTPDNFLTRDGEIIVHLRGKKKGSQWRETTVPANVAPLLQKFLNAKAIKAEKIENGKVVQKPGPFFSERIWKRIRARARLLELGKPLRDGLPTIKEGTSLWHPDVLRHTGMSYRFQQLRTEDPDLTVDAAARRVTEEAGNSKRVAFMHYLRRAAPDASAQFYAIKPKTKNPKLAEVIDLAAVA